MALVNADPDVVAAGRGWAGDFGVVIESEPGKLDELQLRLDQVLAEQPSRLASPVAGEDIMRVRGLAAGPEVGRIKKLLLDLVIDGELPADRDAVLGYLAAHPEL